MVYRGGATMRRNLHVGATGGDYNRMFLCWQEGGLVTESQIHGGDPPPTTEWGWTTAIQVHHGAKVAEKDYRFINNEILADYVTNPAVGSGLVVKGNRFYLLKGGFNGELTMWRTLTIRDNVFHVGPRAKVVGPGAVKLAWEPSGDKNVVGYRVYYGPKTNSYANTHVVTGKTETEIEALKPGKWYFSVAAHKEAFVECWQLSNEVTVEIEG
jgi:hypothetical protein